MMNSYYYQAGVSLPINAPIASSFEEVIKGKLNRDKLATRIEQSQRILRANRLLNLTYNGIGGMNYEMIIMVVIIVILEPCLNPQDSTKP
jgi:hypothetical protein